jgi:hypothetical protein
VSDCEELSGGYLQEMMGIGFRGLSIHMFTMKILRGKRYLKINLHLSRKI